MKISIYLTLGLVVGVLLIGVGIGYSLTSEYKISAYESNAMNLGFPDRTFDLRYVNAMISHHRGAMLLAEQLKSNSARPEMKALAEDILTSEPSAIEELYSWKRAWYGDTKTVRDPIVANLGSSGEKFDLRFLNAMITHHEVGVMMARETQTKSSRVEVIDNAFAVDAFLSGGIETLSGLRKDWYSI